MLTRTRSRTLPSSQSADSNSDSDFLSSQSQSTSDAASFSQLDSGSALSDLDGAAAPLADVISQEAAAATIRIRCPTSLPAHSHHTNSSPIDLTGEEWQSWASRVSRSEVHVLPCSIHYNGAAEVRRYFQPTAVNNPTLASLHSSRSAEPVSDAATANLTFTTASLPAAPAADNEPVASDSRWYTAAFRGRLLTGERVSLPPLTIGLLLADSDGEFNSSNGGSSGDGGSSGGRLSSSKRLRADRRSTSVALVEDCALLDAGAEPAEGSRTAADRADSGGGAQVEWAVCGSFDCVTLWGRDSDWKGADQAALKRTLLEWPAVAAALHDTLDNTAADTSLAER